MQTATLLFGLVSLLRPALAEQNRQAELMSRQELIVLATHIVEDCVGVNLQLLQRLPLTGQLPGAVALPTKRLHRRA
jgi:hypothetical protein